MTLLPLELDVRPLLKNGGEPFQAIMQAVMGLEPGQGLKLYATFCPTPLFDVMANRGFAHQASEIEGGDWEVVFTPKPLDHAEVISSNAGAPQAWPEPERQLDLTDLDPPEPMVRILAAAEKMQPGAVMFVLLAREPLFLFPELIKRGHQWAGNFDDLGETFRMLIRIGSPKDKAHA
ncbi:DUF2249 domain-containing protein [Agrobacterium vitis]|uniref:DUF2249 domain-containing protein n=1 Tax=Rhizobium/Agrobacterium group TaxID=227290 RepID=UPI0008730C4C|nr:MULTISPECIES: DUF2249 domain-containing protein [Rhizobium/Agrobacterium group]MCF1449310.1 DUF2249 domain-containing protein [Allorhizobium ampelinum]MCF1464173.1 DUF2249 domain-containing protein [Allorhizobium ampelinum]MCF1484846.1 DUF2249 domain-containing protein [Allorhizobium ampelinum]MUO71974.1 DUF2249 domain-containing protein [Agrobacterium vitis]